MLDDRKRLKGASMPSKKPLWTKESYREYLRTDHWKELRELTVQHYNNHCVNCHKWITRYKGEVHHLKYDNLFKEKIGTDIVLLCSKCHDLVTKGEITITSTTPVKQIKKQSMRGCGNLWNWRDYNRHVKNNPPVIIGNPYPAPTKGPDKDTTKQDDSPTVYSVLSNSATLPADNITSIDVKEYRLYYKTEHFRELRHKARIHYNDHCAFCKKHVPGKGRLYHLHYNNLYNEQIGVDVIILCHRCYSEAIAKRINRR